MINLDGLEVWAGLGGASLDESNVVVAGIAYDGSAVYRKGAALAPDRIRTLSAVMPPTLEAGSTLQRVRVHDLGNLPAGPEIEHGWPAVADALAAIPKDKILTILGGDHCIAIASVAAQVRRHQDIAVLWFDSHPDLCDFSRGGRWTCGCALIRALDVAQLPPKNVALVGARDFDPEEIRFIDRTEMLMIPTRNLVADPADAIARVTAMVSGRPLHISFDIDVLDPAFAPGTEVPSGGGISTRQAIDFLDAIGKKNKLVGLDVVEISPPIDNGDITTFAALKFIFEFWGRAVDGNG